MNPRLEKILKLPAYQRILILLVLMAVVVALFVYLLYLPAQEEYAQLLDQNNRLERKLEEDRSIARDLPKFRAEYENMEKKLAAALRELPNDKEIPNLLTSIAALAKENGLEVKLFKPGGERIQGFYAEVPVSLQLIGSYHEVALFSDAVGKMSRIVNLGNLSLSSPKRVDGRNVLSIDCMATTFRFVENPPDQGKKGRKK